MMILVFLIVILGMFVIEKIVELCFGKYNLDEVSNDLFKNDIVGLIDKEKLGFKWVGVLLLVVLLLFVWIIVFEDGILCNLEIGFVVYLLFLKGIVVFIFVIFGILGFVYGCVVGIMKNDKDVIDVMSKSMSLMGMYIVLVFFVV